MDSSGSGVLAGGSQHLAGLGNREPVGTGFEKPAEDFHRGINRGRREPQVAGLAGQAMTLELTQGGPVGERQLRRRPWRLFQRGQHGGRGGADRRRHRMLGEHAVVVGRQARRRPGGGRPAPGR